MCLTKILAEQKHPRHRRPIQIQKSKANVISKAGLREKLKYAYTYPKDLNIPRSSKETCCSADKDLTTEVIDGEEFIVFQAQMH